MQFQKALTVPLEGAHNFKNNLICIHRTVSELLCAKSTISELFPKGDVQPISARNLDTAIKAVDKISNEFHEDMEAVERELAARFSENHCQKCGGVFDDDQLHDRDHVPIGGAPPKEHLRICTACLEEQHKQIENVPQVSTGDFVADLESDKTILIGESKEPILSAISAATIENCPGPPTSPKAVIDQQPSQNEAVSARATKKTVKGEILAHELHRGLLPEEPAEQTSLAFTA